MNGFYCTIGYFCAILAYAHGIATNLVVSVLLHPESDLPGTNKVWKMQKATGSSLIHPYLLCEMYASSVTCEME